MLTLLRRLWNYRFSVEVLIEVALWTALPYIVIGLGWAFFHPEQVGHLETQLDRQFPAGAQILAMGVVIVLWPILVITPNVCMR